MARKVGDLRSVVLERVGARACWREAVLMPCPFLPSRCHCNFFGKRVDMGTFFVEARAPRKKANLPPRIVDPPHLQFGCGDFGKPIATFV